MKNLLQQYRIHLLLFLFGLLTLYLPYQVLTNGVDPSWIYALNLFTTMDTVKFGRDVVFTYGPLGWLWGPIFAHNFMQSSVLTALLWAGGLILFYKLLRRPGCNTFKTGLSLLILFCGCPATSSATDLYFLHYVMLALGVLWEDPEDRFAAAYYILCSTIAFLHKFTLTVALGGTVVFYLLARWICRETKNLWPLLLSFVLFPVYYLLYNPSLRDFWAYLKGSWEVSSGYSSAMCLSASDPYVSGIFLLMGLYIITMLCQLAAKNTKNFLMLLWFAPCLFISYKHGYVRADCHAGVASSELLTLLSVIILLFDVRGLSADLRQGARRGLVQGGLILAFLVGSVLNFGIALQPWTSLTTRIQEINLSLYNIQPKKYEERLNNLNEIPYEFVTAIGQSTFTCYPSEIVATARPWNLQGHFRPLFTLQAYSAYTPYLDAQTAEHLYRADAPDYIVFSFYTIDNRLPLLEAPATWKAILDRYQPVAYKDFYFLLERKSSAVAGPSGPAQPQHIETMVVDKNDTIPLDGCSEARIYMELSPKGKLAKLLWKIPEVDAAVLYTNGAERFGRVLPENLRNGITPKYLPCTDQMMEDPEEDCSITEITFSGDGLEYYADEVRVECIYD